MAFSERKVEASTSEDGSSVEESKKLKPFMVDVNVHFHNFPPEEAKKLTRYLIAYPLAAPTKIAARRSKQPATCRRRRNF